MFKNIKDFLKAQPIVNPEDKPRVAVVCKNLILMCHSTTDLFVYSEFIRATGGTPEFKVLEWNDVSFTVVNSDSNYVTNILRYKTEENFEEIKSEEVMQPEEVEEVPAEENIKDRINAVINKHKNKQQKDKSK